MNSIVEDETAPQTVRSRRHTMKVVLLALAVVAIVASVGEEQVARPSLLTLTRSATANAVSVWTGQVAFLWTIETYNATFSLEGPSADASLTAVRILAPTGEVVMTGTLTRLDPLKSVGVCSMHRPDAGATWWSGPVPRAMADELRATGRASYRVEVLRGTSWIPAALIDSGCRGVGRL